MRIRELRSERTSILRVAFLLIIFMFPFARPGLTSPLPSNSQATQSKALEEINKGIEAFKNGKYDEAIQHFTWAKDFDPTSIKAHIYLASAYQSQFIPGSQDEKNLSFARLAIGEYTLALRIDAENLSAIDGLGTIAYALAGSPYSRAKMEESKTYWIRHTKIRPNDSEPYYWIGMIDWTIAFRTNVDIRAHQSYSGRRVRDDEAMPEPLRINFAQQCGEVIDQGIAALNRAMELRPDYDDAMAYLSLLYRQKADTVETTGERDAMIKRADALMDQVKQIKQKQRNRE
jgi:tetratricopeptide (TPR) repeat protein